jgi:type IV pilus assembly protein PilB
VAKINIDGLLSDLGVGHGKAPPPAAAPARPSGFVPLDDPDEPPPAAAGDPAPPTPAVGDAARAAGEPAAPAAPAGAPDAEEALRTVEKNADTVHAILLPSEEGERDQRPDFRAVLVERGIVTTKQLAAAETIVRQSPGLSLTDLLVEQGADEESLYRALAESMGMEFRRIAAGGAEPAFDDRLTHRLTPEFCKQSLVLPLGTESGRIALASARPADVFLLDEARLKLGSRSMKVVVTPPSDILAAVAPLTAEEDQAVNVDEILEDIEEDDVRVEEASDSEVDLEREAGESPVIRYVNYIIQTASKEGASDIHIEPGDKSLKVRFRIDGELFEMMQPPAKMSAAITSRLKIMGNLDISERRLPQDGRIRCTVQGRKLDLRMSTIPATYGEKVVLRILDTRSINVGLEDLGFDENIFTIWKNQIEQPHGIVLVTGPTGSGKTTTLYASLRAMDKKSQNISTVEDPVEYHLDGITQTQTHEKIGMTFARALKALLRQDPDVILVGEIRDQETAHTAVQAALTGHLVLSTLHTNDAPSSITRLVNIGIEPFLLGAAVNAALAQRLVRRICPHCRRKAVFTDEMREFVESQGFRADDLFDGEGCGKCRGTGYQGRVGIYELLVVDDLLRDVIARNPNVSEFRRMCCERGMVTLRQDGFAKAARGLTTVQEIIRATEAVL